MTRTDRIIIGLLLVGVWALTLVTVFDAKPAYAIYIDASEIDGLEDLIREVVEGCNVSGEVYIYDLENGYGELESARIDC